MYSSFWWEVECHLFLIEIYGSLNSVECYGDQMNTRSSCRKARTSSPPNPILSLGISRGPSPVTEGRAPGGLPGPPAGEPAVVIGAREVPLISEPIPGTVPGSGLGGVPIDPSCRTVVGGVCFGNCGLCLTPLGCIIEPGGFLGEAMRGSEIGCPYIRGLRCSGGGWCRDRGDRPG